MTIKLSGPMLAPTTGTEPGHLVVLLHGYGSDGNDLIALGPHFQSALPDALCVAPNGPAACAISPSGYEWFGIDYEGDRVANRQQGLPLARPVIVQFLEDLWDETGLGPAETLLVGFSQGAMMALHVGAALPDPVMGIVAFSGAFIAPEGFGPTSAKSPVCLVHGALDSVVDPSGSAGAERELAAAGFDVRQHVSEGTAHAIDPAGLAFALSFVKEVSQAR